MSIDKMWKSKVVVFMVCVAFQLGISDRALAALNDGTIEVLGGGGGGGFGSGLGGGGGGGGEYRRCTENLSVQSYTVTVGVGGTENDRGETDSSFSGTGISMTADGGNGSDSQTAGSAGTGGSSTNCDTADANSDGGTPGAGTTGSADTGGGGGGGAGYGGKGGNGATQAGGVGGGGGGGGGESGAGGAAGTPPAAGAAGSGGGGAGGVGVTTTYAATSDGAAGTPATYHIVGGGGGGGGDNNTRGGACGAPGAGSGGGELTGAGNGCRGEVRIVYVDSEIAATGGTETTSGSFRIHTFTTSGTFTVSSITAVAPTVSTTDPATNILVGSATLGGNISSTGGADATVRGFAFSTDQTLSTRVATTTDTVGQPFGTGAFTQGISGLLAGLTYYFRAYATNTAGTGYGSIVSFTTGTNTTRSSKLKLFGPLIDFINGRLILR